MENGNFVFDWKNRSSEDVLIMGVIMNDILAQITNMIGIDTMRNLLSEAGTLSSEQLFDITGIDKNQIELILFDFEASEYLSESKTKKK